MGVALGFGLMIAVLWAAPPSASSPSQVVNRELQSKNFAHNNVGTSPRPKVAIYLLCRLPGIIETLSGDLLSS
jgi:hypothetical protein